MSKLDIKYNMNIGSRKASEFRRRRRQTFLH